MIMELTLSEYNELPDYSIAYPKIIPVGAVWKLPLFANPGELLVGKKISETTGQIMRVKIVEVMRVKMVEDQE